MSASSRSRAQRSNDNALVEGKNAHVVRGHLGHEHIPARFADDVDAFARGHLSPFVNFHGLSTAAFMFKGTASADRPWKTLYLSSSTGGGAAQRRSLPNITSRLRGHPGELNRSRRQGRFVPESSDTRASANKALAEPSFHAHFLIGQRCAQGAALRDGGWRWRAEARATLRAAQVTIVLSASLLGAAFGALRLPLQIPPPFPNKLYGAASPGARTRSVPASRRPHSLPARRAPFRAIARAREGRYQRRNTFDTPLPSSGRAGRRPSRLAQCRGRPMRVEPDPTPSSPHPSTTAVIGIRGRLSTPQLHIRSPSQPRRPIANAPTEPPSTTRRTSRIGGSPGARQFSPPTTFSKPSATVTRNQPTPGAPCSDR